MEFTRKRKVNEVTLAEVTCLNCGFKWEKNCSMGFKAEKDFYLNYNPYCTKCSENRKWKIEEIIEIMLPLTDEESSLFSLAKVKL